MPTDRGAPLAAIEAVYREKFPQFHHVAAAITGDAESGADAVHEAFASAIRRRESFRGEGPLDAWLWRAVVNAARKQARRTRSRSAAEAGLVPNGDHGGEHAAAVRALVAALPERQRLALFLRYYADLDYGAIAAALDVAPGTVASTLNAAHAALRPLIQEVRT